MSGPVYVVLLGAGGHAAEVAGYLGDLRAAGAGVVMVGCLDEVGPPGDRGGLRVLGGLDLLASLPDGVPGGDWSFHAAVGDNTVRQRLVQRAEEIGRGRLRPYTIVHPSAHVASGAEVGEGTCLAPGVVVTSRAKIGCHCICNVHSSVSHDTAIGDFVTLNPNSAVCGGAEVGTGAMIGAGATVIHRVTIGAWSIIGAGATVVRDIPAGVTAVGCPARVTKQHLPQGQKRY